MIVTQKAHKILSTTYHIHNLLKIFLAFWEIITIYYILDTVSLSLSTIFFLYFFSFPFLTQYSILDTRYCFPIYSILFCNQGGDFEGGQILALHLRYAIKVILLFVLVFSYKKIKRKEMY